MTELEKLTLAAVNYSKKIESLIPYDYLKFGNEFYTCRDLRDYRYPFERGLQEYIYMLPELPNYLEKNLNVLDIGAGIGKAASEINKLYGCDVVATGIQSLSGSEVPLVIAEASDLPFENGKFDLVISVHGLSWSPNQIESLNEIVRVLKKGGSALIYLIPFIHSILMWYGDSFWEDNSIEKEKANLYEFNPNLILPGASIKIYTTPSPTPIGDYKDCYQVILKKN